MTLQIPSLSQIRDRMNADLDYRLPAAQSRPAKSVLGVLTTVMSAAISSLYGFGQWITEQLDPMTCSEAWLEIWANHLNVPRKAATTATGTVLFNASGSSVEIPAETRLRQSSTGSSYQTTSAGMSSEPVALVALTVGEAGNLNNGEQLMLETPITGVSMQAVVIELSGGADQESVSDWRLRISEKLSDGQLIGDNDDYKRWAKASHPLVVDARVFGNTPDHGQILIRILGEPSQPVLPESVMTDAQGDIDLLCNVGCLVTLQPVLTESVNVRIAGIDEDTQAIIAQDIAALFESRAKFSAQLWPEEIERILELYTDQYTLLEPVSRRAASEHSILVLGELQWL